MSNRIMYSDDDSNPVVNLWTATLNRTINGKRGQKVLRELRDVLLALPEKKLCAEALHSENGEFCALGALAGGRADSRRIN